MNALSTRIDADQVIGTFAILPRVYGGVGQIVFGCDTATGGAVALTTALTAGYIAISAFAGLFASVVSVGSAI